MEIKGLCSICKIVANEKDKELVEFMSNNPNVSPPIEYRVQAWIDLCPECSWEMERISAEISKRIGKRLDDMSSEERNKYLSDTEEETNDD